MDSGRVAALLESLTSCHRHVSIASSVADVGTQPNIWRYCLLGMPSLPQLPLLWRLRCRCWRHANSDSAVAPKCRQGSKIGVPLTAEGRRGRQSSSLLRRPAHCDLPAASSSSSELGGALVET